ncbi:MAG: hypothetical protein H0U22_15535 [Geodermatophilaceae bacterium]|nr:hypothetical protein [Geodermatophilaceae bacterium]
MHRATLDTRKRVLGAEHPDTLDSANDLANVSARVQSTTGLGPSSANC